MTIHSAASGAHGLLVSDDAALLLAILNSPWTPGTLEHALQFPDAMYIHRNTASLSVNPSELGPAILHHRLLEKPNDTDLDDPVLEADEDEPLYRQAVTQCLWHQCQMVFQSSKELGEHIEKVHVQSGKKKYYCEWEQCPRAGLPFTKRHKVCNHVRTHTGERPYVCPEPDCGKRFSRQDTLAVHTRKHNSITARANLHPCPINGCKKLYQTIRALRKHIIVHHPAAASGLALSTMESPSIRSVRRRPKHLEPSEPGSDGTTDSSMEADQAFVPGLGYADLLSSILEKSLASPKLDTQFHPYARNESMRKRIADRNLMQPQMLGYLTPPVLAHDLKREPLIQDVKSGLPTSVADSYFNGIELSAVPLFDLGV